MFASTLENTVLGYTFFEMILNCVVFYMISGLGFWMEDESGVIFITNLVENIINGGKNPLDIFP